MSPATILTIIGIVNGLITLAKDAPSVIEEANSLLAKIAPHVDAAGDGVKGAYSDAHAKLVSGSYDYSSPAPAGQDAPNVVP